MLGALAYGCSVEKLLILFLLLFLTSATIGAGPLARVALVDVVSFAVVSLAGSGGMGGRWVVVSFGMTLHKPWFLHVPIMNGFMSFWVGTILVGIWQSWLF